MNTIVVNNENIKEHFNDIIQNENISYIRKIIIQSKSGKGKTSLLNYLMELCDCHKVMYIYFDFKTLDLKSELNFIDHLIFNFNKFYSNIKFKKYTKCINGYLKSHRKIVLQKINIIKSNIGNLTIPYQMTEHAISQITTAFWEDYNSLLSNQKVILLLDSYEEASDAIKTWLNKYLINFNLNKNALYVVIAGQDSSFKKINLNYGDIKQYSLPERYDLHEWYKYGRQINVRDTSFIESCYRCYNGEPFYMCIALRPQGDWNGK